MSPRGLAALCPESTDPLRLETGFEVGSRIWFRRLQTGFECAVLRQRVASLPKFDTGLLLEISIQDLSPTQNRVPHPSRAAGYAVGRCLSSSNQLFAGITLLLK